MIFLGLERCAGEVITDILNIIETCDPDEAQMRLIMRGLSPIHSILIVLIFNMLYSTFSPSELPTFADYFRQLRDADPTFARHSMTHWTQFLEGPPNHPNEDTYGLIEVRTCFWS